MEKSVSKLNRPGEWAQSVRKALVRFVSTCTKESDFTFANSALELLVLYK